MPNFEVDALKKPPADKTKNTTTMPPKASAVGNKRKLPDKSSCELVSVSEPVATTADNSSTPPSAPQAASAAPKKSRTSKKQRYLKALGIVRPPTDFQMWGEATKPELLRDIESGQPPPERRAAYEASISDKGRCNLNVYRGKLWRPVAEGGFGVVSDDERAHWRAEYAKVRAEWQQRKDAAIAEYPKRPDSPYFLFYRDFYHKYVGEHEGATFEVVAKAATVVWKEKEKTPEFRCYHEKSAELKDEYERKRAAFERKMSTVSTKADN